MHSVRRPCDFQSAEYFGRPHCLRRGQAVFISVSVVRPSGAFLLEGVELVLESDLTYLQKCVEDALCGQACRLIDERGAELQEVMTVFESGLEDGSVVTVVVDATARRRIRRNELAEHASESDCWIALNELVFALPAEFLRAHPGGADIILHFAGTDATAEFESIYHTQHAKKLADQYIIGFLDGAPAVRKHSRLSSQSDHADEIFRAEEIGGVLSFLVRNALVVSLAAMAICQLTRGISDNSTFAAFI